MNKYYKKKKGIGKIFTEFRENDIHKVYYKQKDS